MANLEHRQSIYDCFGADSEARSRHDYLAVISSLPHIELPSRQDLGLARTIEAEIIPRLMLAHAKDERSEARIRSQIRSITREERESFCKIICLGTVEQACAFVAVLREEGVSVETVLLDLLAPTAKKLGEMWEDDDVDFACVTIALCGLQKVLRDISGNVDGVVPRNESGHRALLATPGREQHIFGLLIIDDFFRRAGWDVWTMPSASDQELVDVVRRESFQIAGLSTSTESSLPEIERLISAIRRVSQNQAIVIFVGGRVFAERPELVRVVGADGTATDGREVVNRAMQCVHDRARV